MRIWGRGAARWARRGFVVSLVSGLASTALAETVSAGTTPRAHDDPAGLARWLSGARLGVTAHDLDFFGRSGGGSEEGVNLEIELVARPTLARVWGGDIRPYGHFSANSAGGTNLAGVGLVWTRPVSERGFVEAFAGPTLHDGVGDLDAGPKTETFQRVDREHIVFGSNLVARMGLAAGWRVRERWETGVYYAHYSHGYVLSPDFNEGLDTLGVRAGYRFGVTRRD